MTKSSAKHLRFALFGNEYQARKSNSIQKVISFLRNREAEIYMDRAFYDFLAREIQLQPEVSCVFDGDDFDADFVISMGGDGTFLKAASRVGRKQIPIIGVNVGRLGFLADVLPSEIESALSAICEDHYETERHAVLQLTAVGGELQGCPYALNDIAVLKRDNASMISIRAYINGDYLVTYQADGLILSTPTGSTAYSLSNGGPIIVPQSGNICLTPVAPHSLNVRPIVLSDESEVTLSVTSRSHNYLVAVDGRSEKLDENTKVIISKAPFTVCIVKQQGHSYFSTLREKMMWGADKR